MPSTRVIDLVRMESALKRTYASAAQALQTTPALWPLALNEIFGKERQYLRRSALLDPEHQHRTRPALMRAGFAIIDCIDPLSDDPASEVAFTLEVVAALEGDSNELILLPGDRNIQPLLDHIRRAGCAVVIVAEAERASVYEQYGTVVTLADVASHLCAIASHYRDNELLAAIARHLTDLIEQRGDLPIANAPGAIMLAFPEFYADREHRRWLGFGSLRALLRELTNHEPRLRISSDPEGAISLAPALLPVTQPPMVSPAASPGPPASATTQEPLARMTQAVRRALGRWLRCLEPPATPKPPDAISRPTPPKDSAQDQAMILEQVHRHVQSSPYPLRLGTVAGRVTADALREFQIDLVANQWMAARTFKRFVRPLVEQGDVFMACDVSPGYIGCHRMHRDFLVSGQLDLLAGLPAHARLQAAAVAGQLGVPPVGPVMYATLWRLLVQVRQELQTPRLRLTNLVRERLRAYDLGGETTYMNLLADVLRTAPEHATAQHYAQTCVDLVLERLQQSHQNPEIRELLTIWLGHTENQLPCNEA